MSHTEWSRVRVAGLDLAVLVAAQRRAEKSNQTLRVEAKGRVYPISPSLDSAPLV